jgi:hypothetical protein
VSEKRQTVGFRAVSISDPLHDELNAIGEHFALQVRADDSGAAARALHQVAAVAASLEPAPEHDAPRVSRPAPLPEGPLLRVDDLSTRADTRRRLAEAIHEALDVAELQASRVAVLSVEGLADLDRCRRAVVLRLFPRPAGAAGRLAPDWIDVAAEWVFGDQRPDAPVRLRVLGVERTVPAAEAAGVLHGCAAAHVWCDVVTGDISTRIRTASISFGPAPHVAIAGGGPKCDDDGLIARYELLRSVARELAPEVAYACIDFEETFGDLGTGLSNVDWRSEGGASPNTVAGRLCDRFIPEAFPVQILGPLHVDRLRAERPGRSWGDILPGDRRELIIGEPIDWLPTSDVRIDVRADAWGLLDPLLLRVDDLADVLEGTVPVDEPGTAHAPIATHGVPELEAITIDAERHPRRGTRLTVMELAAWLAGEPHTDDPVSVSPVLRTYTRHLGRGLDDTRRQALKAVVQRLVDTADRSEDDHARAWLLTDWLVREHAPPWLRRAGLTESADRLDGLGTVTQNADLIRAVDLLGNAIVTASRRLEITTAIAGERAEVVDRIAWDVWEEAAERTGWIAASEAVQHEIPIDLAYAADQRVVECSRDPRVRGELEATGHGLGDAIWSAALHEIAVAAWRGAWDATEAFVHHESTFSIRTTLRRTLEAELGPADDLGVELLLDEVDRAVRDELARVVLENDGHPDFWKRAVDAASAGERGASWRRALDETRRVLGETLFDDAIDVAGDELHRWLDQAPRLVGRAVAAAVAREASGVAGRGIAARAAAERLARGGTEQDAEDAARDSIAGIVAELADGALRMVAELVEPRGAGFESSGVEAADVQPASGSVT